jgi:phage antirepressor YoqD-like protein
MKRGQFTVREIVYNGAETIRTSSQTRITPKGRQVIWRAMEKDGLITL